MTESELELLAHAVGDVADTAKALKQLIAFEGKKIGDAFGVTYAKAAKDQIAEAEAEARRWKDCNAELQRQMRVLECHSAAYRALKEFVQDVAHKSDGHDVPVATLMDALAAAQAAGDAKFKQQRAHAADA